MLIEYRFQDKLLHKYLKKYLTAVITQEKLICDGRILLLTDGCESLKSNVYTLVCSDTLSGENIISLPIRRKEVADKVRMALSC